MFLISLDSHNRRRSYGV